MESTNTTTLEVLRDLLKSNTDRVEGFKKAGFDTVDPGLKALFGNMADQGRRNIADIIREIINNKGSTQSVEITYAGKLYEGWVNFKTKFSVNSIKNVLTSCESREAGALRIYQKAKKKAFGAQLKDLIERQTELLKSSHEVIKVYRQAYTNVRKLHA